jgi:hypothetical protein
MNVHPHRIFLADQRLPKGRFAATREKFSGWFISLETALLTGLAVTPATIPEFPEGQTGIMSR